MRRGHAHRRRGRARGGGGNRPGGSGGPEGARPRPLLKGPRRFLGGFGGFLGGLEGILGVWCQEGWGFWSLSEDRGLGRLRFEGGFCLSAGSGLRGGEGSVFLGNLGDFWGL